ncbi:MAG: hypothetical protein HKO02_16320 [Hyphomonadaceae bacterium]|nr:hypothetical protein [Hyphomonadaceae bacterium]
MGFNGTWNITMKTPMGDREAVLTLAQDGDELSGEATADGNATPVKNGKVEDGRAKFNVDLTTPMPITLEFDVAEDGSNLDGSVKLGMFGTSDVTGTPA